MCLNVNNYAVPPDISWLCFRKLQVWNSFVIIFILAINVDYIAYVWFCHIPVKLVSFVMLNHLSLFKCKDLLELYIHFIGLRSSKKMLDGITLFN